MPEKRKNPVFQWWWIIIVVFVAIFAHGYIHGARTASIRFVISTETNIDKEFSDEVDKLDMSSDDGYNALFEEINDRVEAEKKIPTANCPADFVVAYNRYIDSWENVANIVSSHPHVDGTMENVTKNFFRGMVLDFSGPERDQNEWSDWQAKLRESISETEQAKSDVEAKAVQYGVR